MTEARKPRCTCQWADFGDGESGPQPSIVRLSPDCPDPEHRAAFGEEEAIERGYRLSLLGLGDRHVPKADQEFALSLVAFAERELDAQGEDDDGHNVDRACSRAAEALRVLRGARKASLPLMDAGSDNPLEASIARLRGEGVEGR